MSIFTRIFVVLIAGLFLVIAGWAVIDGNIGAAIGAFVFFAAVAFIGIMGWFVTSIPAPPLTPSEAATSNLFSIAKLCGKHVPSWKGQLIKYGLPALWIGAVLLSIYRFMSSIGR